MSGVGDPRYQLSFELPAAHTGVRIGRNVIRHFTRLCGLDYEGVSSLELVVSELLANCIDHGGGDAALSEAELDTDVRMRLEIVLREQAWSLTVTDQGGGDPEEVERFLASDTLPDLENERGRGLFLVSQMVDRMEVKRSPDGRGLALTVEKLHGGGSGA